MLSSAQEDKARPALVEFFKNVKETGEEAGWTAKIKLKICKTAFSVQWERLRCKTYFWGFVYSFLFIWKADDKEGDLPSPASLPKYSQMDWAGTGWSHKTGAQGTQAPPLSSAACQAREQVARSELEAGPGLMHTHMGCGQLKCCSNMLHHSTYILQVFGLRPVRTLYRIGIPALLLKTEFRIEGTDWELRAWLLKTLTHCYFDWSFESILL